MRTLITEYLGYYLLQLLPSKVHIIVERTTTTLYRTKSLFLLCLLSAVFRIPRVPHILGGDGALLVVESTSLLQGGILPWIIHPLSVFGVTAFSGYPFGSVVSMAGLILLSGGNIDFATFLFTAGFAIVGVIACYKLMAYIFDDERLHWIGAALYTFMPILYDYTYSTSSSRGPLLALFPLMILALLKSINGNTPKEITTAVIYVVISMLFHRMAFAFFSFVAVAIVIKLIKNVSTKRGRETNRAVRVNRQLCMLFGVGALSIFVLSILLFGLSPKTDLPDEFYVGPLTVIDQSWFGIGIDYFLFYSIELVLALFGVFFVLKTLWTSDILFDEKNSKLVLLLFFLIPLVFFLRTPAYTRHLIAPFIVILAVIGFKELTEKHRRLFQFTFIIHVFTFALFMQLYSLLWRDITFFATVSSIGCIAVAVLAITDVRTPTIRGRSIRSPEYCQKMAILLVVFIMLSSYTNRDMRYETTIGDTIFSASVSNEEIIVAEYIREALLISPGIKMILGSHRHLSMRIASFAGTEYLSNPHGTQLLSVGYITPQNALVNSTLYLLSNLLDLHLYEHIPPSRYGKQS
ncbi:MAG: hypothetical protein ACXABY_05495 [Candidatus Thorarchaeota archaeon]|jgi:hypothetical protein